MAVKIDNVLYLYKRCDGFVFCEPGEATGTVTENDPLGYNTDTAVVVDIFMSKKIELLHI